MAQCEFKSSTCNLEFGVTFLCSVTAVSMGLFKCARVYPRTPSDSPSTEMQYAMQRTADGRSFLMAGNLLEITQIEDSELSQRVYQQNWVPVQR